MSEKPVLVTGATGYVGGRLVPQLLKSGHRVRVMGRSIEKLQCRPWADQPGLEIVQADMLDRKSLKVALHGCWAAFYLVHSMKAGKNEFAAKDRQAARNMVLAAEETGLEKIIYLGGLGHDDSSFSDHLRSRSEVARILQSGSVPLTFLRAAVILGSGSASFEILRYLVERLPVMITPRWVHTLSQPIAIRNVLNYLQGCLEHEETTGQTYDICGPDILTYEHLMEIYAEEAGLPKRLIIPVPLLSPELSSYWIHLLTPIPSSMARLLAEGLRNKVVCRETRIRSVIPQELLTCRQAIRLALDRVGQGRIDTCWSDAGELHVPEWTTCGDADYAGGTILECGYRIVLRAEPKDVWTVLTALGGKKGYLFANVLWRMRGAIDRLLGGIGLNRGRRNPLDLRVGDALDFWRVLDLEEPRRILLLAEMKVPGEALMEFTVHSIGNGRLELQQLSRFLPKGLLGLIYWYVLYPVHQWLYRGMLEKLAKEIKKPILKGPDRFAPGRHHVCYVQANQNLRQLSYEKEK
jgi:uncharacterized protein YbjT (DUF2867 family)